MSKKGVTIIIPCYNAGNFLKESVDSILVQPFRYPFEIIVVDDGSTDVVTLSVLEKIKRKLSCKVITISQNRGAQYARNVGLRSASYDFVFTIDADDRLNTDPNILKQGTYADRAVDVLSSSPDVAFVHSSTLMFGNCTGFTISTTYPTTTTLILEKHHASIEIVYRRQDALDAGLYDEKIQKWQEWSFAVGLLNSRFLSGRENNIVFLQLPYYCYRIHSQGQRISSRKVDEKK